MGARVSGDQARRFIGLAGCASVFQLDKEPRAGRLTAAMPAIAAHGAVLPRATAVCLAPVFCAGRQRA